MAAFQRHGVMAVLIPVDPAAAGAVQDLRAAGRASPASASRASRSPSRSAAARAISSKDCSPSGTATARWPSFTQHGKAASLVVVGLLVVGLAGYLLWSKARGAQTPIIIYHSAIIDDPELSVVIPIRNEAPSLVELHRELTDTLTAWGRPYEIIIVDDGSTDESFEILARLQAVDPHLRVIRFRRNFGQTAAFAAGFDHARGRLIVTSDGDLQNDPRDIPGDGRDARAAATTSSAAGGRIGRTRSCRGGCRR